MCLHPVQSHLSAGDFFRLVWWRARSWARWRTCKAHVFTPSMLAGSRSYISIDWTSSQQPSPLCLTRSGRGGFAYSLDETSMKMRGRPSPLLADIGDLADGAQHLTQGHVFSDTFLKHWARNVSSSKITDAVLIRRITVQQIVAFLCFLKNKGFFKSEELSSSVFTDTQFPPFTEGTALDLEITTRHLSGSSFFFFFYTELYTHAHLFSSILKKYLNFALN